MDKANCIDNLGLPGTRQNDGSLDMGDSAAVYFNIAALSDISVNGAAYWHNEAKAPIRHPDASKWWGQPDRFSRDQMIPLLCYSALKGPQLITKLVFKSHLKRFLLLAWNTKANGAMHTPDKLPDITGPEIFGLWVRIFAAKAVMPIPFCVRPLLELCDLETLVNALLWRFYQPKTNRVTRNHMLIAITQREVMPTFVSRLADKINDYKDLIDRWEAHCIAVGEYPTADLFKQKLKVQ